MQNDAWARIRQERIVLFVWWLSLTVLFVFSSDAVVQLLALVCGLRALIALKDL